MVSKFKIKKTEKGLYTWVFYAGNGMPLAYGRNYLGMEACRSAVKSIIQQMAKAVEYEDKG
jgi:uncharacterized protein YegP (UPF0339 family)